MKNLIKPLFILLFLIAGCASQDETPANDTVWHVSPTFDWNGIQMRGIEQRLAIIDQPIQAGETTEFAWHFWGHLDEVTGKLMIAADHQQSGRSLILIEKTYMLPATPKNDADNYFPTMLALPAPGLWKLNVYIGDRYFDNVIVEAYE